MAFSLGTNAEAAPTTSRASLLAPPPPATVVERLHLVSDARRFLEAVRAGRHPRADLVGLARARRQARTVQAVEADQVGARIPGSARR